MSSSQYGRPAITSPSQDYYQLMFEGADIYATIWQPLLKSIGRWQLEVAGLGMKQGQAAIAWTYDVARSYTPGDAVAANVRYFDTVSTQFAQSSQRLAASVARSVEKPLHSEIVTLPVRRGHDMIILPEPEEYHGETRKVA